MAKSLAFLLVLAASLSGTLAYSDNCSGSFFCNKGMGSLCTGAFQRFTDNTVYNGYTSRANGHCTAIYRCDGSYPSLTGRQIKSLFAPIYSGQGCKGCGSHAFNGGQCEVTLNYCSNCVDSGNPN
ncbi:meiotically up-regulated gene family-domain-containing protein [Dissophora ornata]|nr:hypothetical protein BGZ58_009868 [Dissophora ornata]KAI8595869.1 meiotically up-regulated gene family-domain-containing protein [Dissophora ornata]